MIPYSHLMYFLFLVMLLLPTIVLGLLGKRSILLNTAVSIIGVLTIFYSQLNQFVFFMVYLLWQLCLVLSYVRYRQKKNETKVFYIAIILAIVPIAAVKIAPLFHDKIHWFTQSNPLQLKEIIGFLGVSYISFKVIQLVIEIRDGLIKELSLYKVLRFVLFFPAFSSGPIDRYRRFEKDLEKTTFEKGEYSNLVLQGIERIFWGFLYKFIIAYFLYKCLSSSELTEVNSFKSILSYMYVYSLYLFFDFAGYSQFAIGVSKFFGVNTPDNFNKPFLSKNIKDFWNRWHITLSFWFRDFVFMRMTFFITKKKLIKNRYAIAAVSYLSLFLLMGLWHGITWYYITYGLYHAILIIAYDWLDRMNKKKKWVPKNKVLDVVAIVITFQFICFGFLLFSGRLNEPLIHWIKHIF